MQNIQNYGAKLVLGRGKYDSNKEALAELHWLSIKSRIKFKILVLVFKSLRGDARIPNEHEIQQHERQTSDPKNSKTNFCI